MAVRPRRRRGARRQGRLFCHRQGTRQAPPQGCADEYGSAECERVRLMLGSLSFVGRRRVSYFSKMNRTIGLFAPIPPSKFFPKRVNRMSKFIYILFKP